MENENVDVQEQVQDTSVEQSTAVEQPTIEQGAVQQQEVQQEVQQEEQPTDGNVIKAGGLVMIKNPETGAVEIVEESEENEEVKEDVTDNDSKKAPSASDTNTDNTATKATELNNIAQKAEYTPQELEEAIRTNTLDETRMPPTVREQWKVAQYNEAIKKAVEPPKNTQEVPKEQMEQVQQVRAKFFSDIESRATEQAMADIGLTQDDIEAAEYSDDPDLATKVKAFNTAKEFNRQVMLEQVQAKMNEHKAVAEKQAEIMNSAKTYFAKEVIPNEPHWKEIDDLMNTRYLDLPLREGEKIKGVYERWGRNALTFEDIDVAKKYFEDTKLAYYAQKNGLKGNVPSRSKPPVVETPGAKPQAPRAVFDAKAFRGADVRTKDAFFNKLFETMDNKG